MTGSLVLIALASFAPHQDALTIDQAVELAVTKAFSVRAAQGAADQARFNQSVASNALRPKVTASGQYIRLAEGVSFSSGGGGFGGSTADSKQINVVLSQLIDVFGVTRKAVDARKYQKLASEMDVETQVNQVKSLARDQFYLVLQAKELVKVQDEELFNANKRVENARLKEAQGDVSHFDVLRFETDAKRSEQALVEAQGNYELAKQALNNILGRPIDTQFEPQDVVGLDAVEVDADKAVEVAQANRPEVKANDFLVQAAASLTDLERGSLKPTLTLSTQYNRTIDPAPGQTVQSLFGILTLSVPISDAGLSKDRTAAARAFQEQAEVRFEQTRLAVSLDVRNALTRIATTHKAYEVALAGRDLARESLRLAQLRYDEGAGILLDVTSAQSELTRSQGAVVTARYQYLSAVAALKRALGTDDLALTAEGNDPR